MKKFIFAAALLLIGTADLTAQTPQTPPGIAQTTAPKTLAVTTSSARVELTGDLTLFPVLVIINEGTTTAFVKTGTVAVTAAVTDLAIPGKSWRAIWLAPGTYIAGITSADSTTLRLSQSSGAPSIGMGG